MSEAEPGKHKVRFARHLVGASRGLRSALYRVGRRYETWVGRALDAALTPSEKQALSILLYDDTFDPDRDERGLYGWEVTWFEKRLPPPPATVFVGAAGAGREAAALVDRGYRIVAIEPSPRAADHCRRVLGASATVFNGSYADLIDAVFGDPPTALPWVSATRVDAVLLGWGSYGHVLRREERFRLLRACHALCPEGPILLSVFRPSKPPAWKSNDSVCFFTWGGFLAEPTADELAGDGRRLGREVIASLDAPSPHFTLRPGERATDAHATPALREPVP